MVQVRRGCTAVFPSWAVQWRYCAWRCPLEHNPSAAFLSLLGATVIWGSGGVVYGLPASFLSVSARALNVF